MKPITCLLVLPVLVAGAVGCSGQEDALGGVGEQEGEPDAATTSDAQASNSTSSDPVLTTEPQPDAAVALPGEAFGFDLAESVFVELSGPSVVTGSSAERLDWDLRFDGYLAFTNGGAAGVGKGAAFGPSTELDLLFDTIPDVPMRADLSDGALAGWFWFSDIGVVSRYRIYGIRDAADRNFKVQILDYYDEVDGQRVSAMYSIRYAELTEGQEGEAIELRGIDATAGGISAPADAPAGCVDLTRGEVLALTKDQWSSRDDWHLCFQRTEVFLNGGLSGPGDVKAVDLDVDPETGEDPGLSDAEMLRTAESELERFDAVTRDDLDASYLGWDKVYEVLPRIGTRWVMGTAEAPEPVPGTWFVRGADGESYFAIYFTEVTPSTQTEPPRVQMQVKPLRPIE